MKISISSITRRELMISIRYRHRRMKALQRNLKDSVVYSAFVNKPAKQYPRNIYIHGISIYS